MFAFPRSAVSLSVTALGLAVLLSAADAPRRPSAPAAPAGQPPQDWLAAIQADLAQSEYFVSGAEPQAPNRAHGLRTYFTPRGPRVVPRERDAKNPWEWQLALARYGHESELRAPLAAQASAKDNRVEYRRGPLTEWYVNDERGLEQGFTLASPPPGDGKLVFEIAVHGTLHAEHPEDAIQFADEHGSPIIRYAELKSYDARGRELASSFAPTQDLQTVRIEVDATGAVYPVTIDPLSTGTTWAPQGNFVSAKFGICVATA